jgi:hypothetical protein
VLADFVAKFTGVTEKMSPDKGLWIIYVDGLEAKKSGGQE